MPHMLQQHPCHDSNESPRGIDWRRIVRMTFVPIFLHAVLAFPCRAETPMFLDSHVENDRYYISLTGLNPCSARHPQRMMAFVDTKDRQFLQIACYEYIGSKIKVYLINEVLEFDASDEKYEFRESQCPDCKPAIIDSILPG